MVISIAIAMSNFLRGHLEFGPLPRVKTRENDSVVFSNGAIFNGGSMVEQIELYITTTPLGHLNNFKNH